MIRTRRWLIALVVLIAASGHRLALGQSDQRPLSIASTVPTDDDQIDLVFVQSKRPFHLRIHARRGDKSYQGVWYDYLARLFQSLDVDQSGDLNETEFRQGPWTLYRRGGINRFQDHSFIDFDQAPRDGKITLAELMQRAVRFASLIEVTGASQRSRSSDPLFMLLDQNYDEQLDAHEVANVFEKLRRYDRNDDELFSRTDLQPDQSEIPENMVPRPSDRMRNSRPAPLVIDRKPGESTASLARRLYRHYEGLDRRITRNEIDLPDEEFQQADINNDASLKLEEWTTWFESRAPDLEVIVDLAADRKSTAPIQRVDRAPDGERSLAMKFDGDGALIVRLGFDELTISASHEPNEQEAEQLALNRTAQRKQQFGLLDRDGNGYLERSEIGNDAAQAFVAMDRDGDGKVFIEELQAYAQLQAELAAHQTFVQIDTRGGTLFDILDSGDQHLSQRDLQALPGLVSAWDCDGDGRLSLDEIPRRFRLVVRPGELANIGVLDFTSAPLVLAPGPAIAPARGPRWFQRMDRNGDGDLSPREFLGPIEMFRQLDADGDGLISPAEAAAAR